MPCVSNTGSRVPAAQLQLGWIPPAEAALTEAETLVKDSDVAVVFVGLSSELEGEEMRGREHPRFSWRRPHQS